MCRGSNLELPSTNSWLYERGDDPNDPLGLPPFGYFQNISLVTGISYKRVLTNNWKWRSEIFGYKLKQSPYAVYSASYLTYGINSGIEKQLNFKLNWLHLNIYNLLNFNRLSLDAKYLQYGNGSMNLKHTRIGIINGISTEITFFKTVSLEGGIEFHSHYNRIKRDYFIEYFDTSIPDYSWNGIDHNFYAFRIAYFAGIGIKF